MVSSIVLCIKYKRFKVIKTDTYDVKPSKETKKEAPPKKPSGLPRSIESPKQTVPKRSVIPTASRLPTKKEEPKPIKPIIITPELTDQFETFSKLGDKGSGKEITLQNINRWLKHASIIDGKTVTITDTSIFFKQVARTNRTIEIEEFKQFSEILIRNRKLDTEEYQEKLISCGDLVSRSNRNSMSDDMPSPTPASTEFKDVFKSFAKFGDIKSSGDQITLSNIDKWFKQAKIIDGKKVTTVDTGIYFKQKAKTKRSLNLPEFSDFLQTLCKQKKLESEDVKSKLVACGAPGTTRTTAAVKNSAIDRLTDHKKFTGTHKKRFDKETGKGKGMEGRVDVVDKSGYVSGYKDKNTYDQTH